MASNSNRLGPGVLQADRDALAAIQSMNDYTPANAAYGKETLAARSAAMDAARLAEFNAQNALNAARDAANAAEHDFHDSILGAKTQVVAQYGDDSDQVQAVGLKKKSERKSATRRAPPKSTT